MENKGLLHLKKLEGTSGIINAMKLCRIDLCYSFLKKKNCSSVAMTKEKQHHFRKLRRLIAASIDVSTTDFESVYCSACGGRLKVEKKQHMAQHLSGKYHRMNMETWQRK